MWWSAPVFLLLAGTNFHERENIVKIRSLKEVRRKAEGPIGIHRDQWEALESKNKLAYFCSTVLPTNLLSNTIEAAKRGLVVKRLMELLFFVCVCLRPSAVNRNRDLKV